MSEFDYVCVCVLKYVLPHKKSDQTLYPSACGKLFCFLFTGGCFKLCEPSIYLICILVIHLCYCVFSVTMDQEQWYYRELLRVMASSYVVLNVSIWIKNTSWCSC